MADLLLFVHLWHPYVQWAHAQSGQFTVSLLQGQHMPFTKTLPVQALPFAASRLSGRQVRARITAFWATATIVGAVLGSTSFEGYWQRPQSSHGIIPASFKMDVRLRGSTATRFEFVMPIQRRYSLC